MRDSNSNDRGSDQSVSGIPSSLPKDDFVAYSDALLGSYRGRGTTAEAPDPEMLDRLTRYAEGTLPEDEREPIRELLHDHPAYYEIVLRTLRERRGAAAHPAGDGRPTTATTAAAETATPVAVARPPARSALVDRFVRTVVTASRRGGARGQLGQALEALGAGSWDAASRALDNILGSTDRAADFDISSVHNARGAALLGRCDYKAARHAFERAHERAGHKAEKTIAQTGLEVVRWAEHAAPSASPGEELESRLAHAEKVVRRLERGASAEGDGEGAV